MDAYRPLIDRMSWGGQAWHAWHASQGGHAGRPRVCDHAWQGACVAGGHAWGACVVGAYMAVGVCVAEGDMCGIGGMHGGGVHGRGCA